MKIITENGYTIRTGENSSDNWKLLDETDGENCYLIHLSHYPSPYVIVSSTEGDVTPSQIFNGAIECKANTKQKNISRLSVDYSHRSNVEKGNVTGEMVWKSKRKTKSIII
jgi:predicted ribosome quality control (RQC) complex YloA/Tae2 family protein